MAVNPTNLSIDIKDLIELLQNNQINAQKRRRQSQDSDKLSIIYSASEPESSLADKQNSRNSSNNSNRFVSNREMEQISMLFKDIRKSGLTSEQNKIVNKLESVIDQIKKQMTTCESKLKIIQVQYEQQKKGTDQILKALVKMDAAEKELWSDYTKLSNRYGELQEEYERVKEENEILTRQCHQNKNDVDFMRKLVLVANQNYESIQKKCKQLERNYNRQQKSSPQITNRSISTTKKSAFSPTISEKANISAKKGDLQDNYRKLVLKTLKAKTIK